MLKVSRKLFITSAFAVAVCAVGPLTVTWAQDKMADDHMKMADQHMKMTDEQMKMASDHMDKMKTMAADQTQAQKMTLDLAKMMVMEHMAMQMAMDPKFKEMVMHSMEDVNMNKVHDDAKKMAEDPAQMAKIQQDIKSDPKAMDMMMHMATKMVMQDKSMMHDDHMMHDDKMKDMPADKK